MTDFLGFNVEFTLLSSTVVAILYLCYHLGMWIKYRRRET